MRTIVPMLVLAALPLGAAHAADDPLGALKWKARPVVVLSDSRDDPRVARQISALDHSKPALDDRNIKVLQDAEPGSRLRRQLGVSERGFSVVLVGKDGGVKKVWRDPVDPQQIFTLIDQMPMRRDEMKG